MKFFTTFLKRNRKAGPVSEIITSPLVGAISGTEIGHYYSTISESRPYVIAMREVAAESLYSLG